MGVVFVVSIGWMKTYVCFCLLLRREVWLFGGLGKLSFSRLGFQGCLGVRLSLVSDLMSVRNVSLAQNRALAPREELRNASFHNCRGFVIIHGDAGTLGPELGGDAGT